MIHQVPTAAPDQATCWHPTPRRWMILWNGWTAKLCGRCAAVVTGPVLRCFATTRTGKRDCSLPAGHGEHPRWPRAHGEVAS